MQPASTELRPSSDMAESDMLDGVDPEEEQSVLLPCGPIVFPVEVVFKKELEGRVGNLGTCMFGDGGAKGVAEAS